jgi:coenzyme F420 biosynthesis associated uncharacterized protein
LTQGPIDWLLAERVATRLAARHPAAYLAGSDLTSDLDEFTTQAEDLVAVETGLRSLVGPARARVVDRAGWIRANLSSFERLLRPLTDKVAGQLEARGAKGKPLGVARAITGVEVGTLLGWMSGRVLGQYDLLVVDDDNAADQDIVYYVGPNVAALERRFGFPPREFRLWLALHEVTHRAQFTGVPWLRTYYLSLVRELVESFDVDPQVLAARLKGIIGSLRHGRDALADGGLAAVLATPAQRQVLGRIGGLMSLLEGHGDVTMSRAGGDLVPSAGRFARVLGERRKSAPTPTRVLQRLLGLEAKMAQYQQGEKFIHAIEAAAGPRAVDRCWDSAEQLPTLEEIREPQLWLRRVGVAVA